MADEGEYQTRTGFSWCEVDPFISRLESVRKKEETAQLRLSLREIWILNAALNEVCNGLSLDEGQFLKIFGAGKDFGRHFLMRSVGEVECLLKPEASDPSRV